MTSAATEGEGGGNKLTYNFGTHTLTSTNFKGNVEGNLTGTADDADAVNVVEKSNDTTCNLVFVTDTTGTKALFTNSGLKYNSTDGHLETSGDLITKKFIHLDGTATNSGDIHTKGGHDGIAVIRNDTNHGSLGSGSGEIRIAGTVGGSAKTIATFDPNNAATSAPELRCDGDVVAFATSDINLKKNIKPIANSLDKINSISGNTFSWINTSEEDVGVIAQEIEKLGLPGITTTRDNGTKAVKYEKLVPILIEAIKELSAEVTALKNK